MSRCENGSTNEVEKYKNIVDLPLELLLIIYKDFQLTDLLSAAKMHPLSYAAAQMTFQSNYANKTFQIGVSSGCSGKKVLKVNSNIVLCDIQATIDVLSLFGHLISKIIINYDCFDSNEVKQIHEFINRNCADTMESIEFIQCGNEYDQLKGPFLKVEDVQFRSGTLKSVRINEMFPNLRRLGTGLTTFSDPEVFEKNFPHLHHFSIGPSLLGNAAVLENTIKMNQQLRSLSFNQCNITLLRMLSENAPNVDHIDIPGTLTLSEDNGAEIRLDNVKTFKFGRTYRLTGKNPLVFIHLESFDYIGSLDDWFDIILQNKNLRELSLGQISDEQLSQIANELANLEGITAWIETENATHKIIDFLQTNVNLRKATLLPMDLDTSKEIITQLSPQWNVTVVNKTPIFIKNVNLY